MDSNNVNTVPNGVQTEPNAPRLNPKKMTTCKVCGAPIAKNAKKCPSCGAKNKKPIYKKLWFWVLAIIVVAIVVKSVKRSGLDVKNPSAKVTADMILWEFEKDTDASEKKYKDTVVAVTGRVQGVSNDSITIEGFSEKLTIVTIRAKMADTEDVKKATKGEVITVSGICDGKSFGAIELEKAIIDDSLATTPNYASPMTVGIEDLLKAYKDNEVSADEKYWEKVVTFTGEVDYVTVMTDNLNYIILKPEGSGESLDTIWEGVQVFFENRADFEKIKSDVNPNALGGAQNKLTITVVGVCYGKGIIYDTMVCRAKLK